MRPYMRAPGRTSNSAAGAASSQRLGHQAHERDVGAARFAHAVVGRVQALEGGVPFRLGKLGNEPGQSAALLESEIVVVHAEKGTPIPVAGATAGPLGKVLFLARGNWDKVHVAAREGPVGHRFGHFSARSAERLHDLAAVPA